MVKTQKRLRNAEFEQRARDIGITEKALIAQKVAIWEGMWTAKQSGRDIEVSSLVALHFGSRGGNIAD